MSNSDIADAMMQALTNSGALDKLFEYKQPDGRACCICGATNRPLACGLIRGSKSSAGIHFSSHWDVCNQCAPPCGKCSLPIVTEAVRQFMARKQMERAENSSVFLGIHCGHRRFLGFTF